MLYINRFFEVNLTTSTNTSYYYLGGSLIAMSVNSTLRYMHQDHLTGTSLTTSANGTLLGTIKYTPFGETRSVSGEIYTDKKFTGQRLDGTGLYFYNARYYDPTIGRFISADTIISNPADPQCFNRYSYCLNNPLKFVDPSGNEVAIGGVTTGDLENWVDNMDYWALVAWGLSLTDADRELWDAWSAFAGAAPELAEALLNDPNIIPIRYTNLPKNILGQGSLKDGIDINILLKGQIETVASVMAHEGFHVLMDIWGFDIPSYFEEACAHSYERAVGRALGIFTLEYWLTYPTKFFDNIISGLDKLNLSNVMNYAWIARYVSNDNWERIYGNSVLKREGNVISYGAPPNFPNEGYELMRDLYIQYHPR